MREPPRFRRQSRPPVGLELITSLHPQKRQHSWASQFAGCISIIKPYRSQESSLAESCDLMKPGCTDGWLIVVAENAQGWTVLQYCSIIESWLSNEPKAGKAWWSPRSRS